MFKKNIGLPDRLFRLSLGVFLLLAGAYFKSWLLLAAGLFSIFQGAAGWCLLYQLIGRNTCPLPSAGLTRLNK